MKKIAEFPNLVGAQIAFALLDANGFCPMPLPVSDHGSMTGANHFYYIHVVEAEVAEARVLLEENGYNQNLIRPQ